MRKLLFAVACFGLLALPVVAQNVPPFYDHWTNTDGSLESGWVVAIPSGSSDYFNSRYDSPPSMPGFLTSSPFAGVALGSGDFGAGTSYPRAGMADAAALDPSGNTPDLTTGASAGAVAGGGAVYNYVFGAFGGNYIPGSEPQHVFCQFPPGDSGLLGIGQDDNPPQGNFSGWTQDGYATVANGTGADFGLGAVGDMITALQGLPGRCNGHLLQFINGGDETGDFATVTVGAGGFYGIAFWSSCNRTLWILFLSFLGAPIKKLTPVLPTIPQGGGGYLRVGSNWPFGFGGFTFNFVAVGGVAGIKGTVHTSNEVTLYTLQDPQCNWGIRDDGIVEGGWVVSIPSGSSDYFSVWFNCLTPPGVNNVTNFELSVLDFGTTATAYPTSGVYTSNVGLDPSGWTPNLGAGWGVQPFTFVPLTFDTAAPYVVNDITPDIPYATFGTDNVSGVMQFPPGDPGLLGVGGDTLPTTGQNWASTWTLDGYTTPANIAGYAGWGIRLGSN